MATGSGPIVRPRLGLHTVYEGADPSVDIIAVHGLGASHPWEGETEASTKSSRKYINWLSHPDMLPSKIPNSRIRTFNYESAWLFDAPQQTRMNCAIQLYNAIDDERCAPGQINTIKNRPIVFIGHSFGGVVIEQAILIGAQQQSTSSNGMNLAMLTAGIVFLGTPHRGSRASSWAHLLANISSSLGLNAEPRILKDLEAFSETMKDLLYDFSQWLHRYQVSTWCFFESHPTDVGARASSWFDNVYFETIVGEESACIDGTRKERLSADHMKLAKFNGPDDPNYNAIYPKLQRLADNAVSATKLRAHPQPYISDNRNVPAEHVKCLRSLFYDSEQPTDHKSRLLRTKGSRTKGTCKWIPQKDEYVKWRYSEDKSLLRITGPPGMGKTMMSTYLIEELIRYAEISDALFAFFFCDGMPELDQAARVVRILLAQLLQQSPKLFAHIQAEYEIHQDQLRNRFDALWRIVRQIIADPDSPTIVFLVDGLDECSSETQQTLSKEIVELFRPQVAMRAKILILSRPEPVIESVFGSIGDTIPIESAGVKSDLARYIDQEMQKLDNSKHLDKWTHNAIKDTLNKKNDGTFLWVSFVVEDLRGAKTGKQMMAMLSTLPGKLFDIYDRILLKIPKHEQNEAIQVLQTIVSRHEPWSPDELAMLCCMLDPDVTSFPQPDEFGQWLNYHSYCGSLVRVISPENVDRSYFLVEVVHSSVRDYLLSPYLRQHPELSRYGCDVFESRLSIFSACCKFRKLLGPLNIAQHNLGNLEDTYRAYKFEKLPLLGYCSCAVSWNLISDCEDDEALLKRVCDVIDNVRDPGFLHLAFTSRMANLSDHLLKQDWVDTNWIEDDETILGAAVRWLDDLYDDDGRLTTSVSSEDSLSLSTEAQTSAQVDRILPFYRDDHPFEKLLKHPQLDVNLQNGRALWESLIYGSHRTIVHRLLSHHDINVNVSDDVYGSPLGFACGRGELQTISILLKHPRIDFGVQNRYGDTALHNAASEGHADAVGALLKHPGIDINVQNRHGNTALHRAALGGYADIIGALLKHPDIDMNVQDRHGNTALHDAAIGGHADAVGTLLKHPNIDINIQNRSGDTALHRAARWGHTDTTRTILEHPNIDINIGDHDGETALHNAAWKGHADIVKALLEHPNIDPNIGDHNGGTALHYAAFLGHADIVGILLEHPHANINIRNRKGTTALHYAARDGNVDTVGTLLEHSNIDINIGNSIGRPALDYAVKGVHSDVVKLLLQRPDIDLGVVDENGFTIFQWPQWRYCCAVRRMIYERLAAERQDNITPDPRFWIWSPNGLLMMISDQIQAKEAWADEKLKWLKRRFGWMPPGFGFSLSPWAGLRLVGT